MAERKSIAWSHATDIGDSHFPCHYCDRSYSHKGAAKVRVHLLACKMLRDEAVRGALSHEIAKGKRQGRAAEPGPTNTQAKRS